MSRAAERVLKEKRSTLRGHEGLEGKLRVDSICETGSSGLLGLTSLSEESNLLVGSVGESEDSF